MTTTELSNEFDIIYNGIASNASPGIDLYEKSIYLTKAQLELIKDYYTPKGNKYKTGFEGSSKRRNDLLELIRNYISVNQVASADQISDLSKFFRIPNDTFLIIQEKIKISSSDLCINNKEIKVVPKTHDEFNTQIDNPFKKPSIKVAWRMDYYSQVGNNKNVEILTPYDVFNYRMRYIKYPPPIILTDLISGFPGENLSIDGVTIAQTCVLSDSMHREIIDRAVALAFADYKQGSLQARLQMNTRNE